MTFASCVQPHRLRWASSLALVAAVAVAQQSEVPDDPLARWIPVLEAARSDIDAAERPFLDSELFEIDLGRGALASARQRLPARLTKSDSAKALQLLTAHAERGELAAARRLLRGTAGFDQSAALWTLALAEARSGDDNLEQTLSRLPQAHGPLLRELSRAFASEPAPRGEVRQALLALPASAERETCLAVLIEAAQAAGDEAELLAGVAALSGGKAGMLRSLSLQAAARGDFAQAERLAVLIDNTHDRAWCWLQLLRQAVRRGNQQFAEKCWEQAEATDSTSKFLGFTWAQAARARARQLQQVGATAAAVEMLQAMVERWLPLTDPRTRQEAVLELVLAQYELAAVDEAAASFAALLRSHGEQAERVAARLRVELAAALAAAGMPELALRDAPDFADAAVLYTFGAAFGRAGAHGQVEDFWQRLPESPKRIVFLRSYLMNAVRS